MTVAHTINNWHRHLIDQPWDGVVFVSGGCSLPATERSRSPHAALPLACLLALAVSLAHAQQLPDAGRMLREATPPPQAMTPLPEPALSAPQGRATRPPVAPQGEGLSLVLRNVQFNGNSVFSRDELTALVADKLGHNVTLADLDSLAARVTAHYRRAGYVLAQTVIPQQDVAAGSVEMSVIEGRLGRIRIERIADIPMSEMVVEKMLAGLHPGSPLTQKTIERAILLLSDLPGLAVQSSLEAGDEAGTFDLIIELKPAPRINLSVDLDNQGSNATGEYRIGALGRVNSPFGLADNLDLRLLNSFGNGLTFGRIAYELPLGYSGTRASLAYAQVAYELGKEFAALQAQGRAKLVEFAFTHPLLRSRAHNLVAKLGVEQKRLNDNIGAVMQASDKHVQNLSAGLGYEGSDTWLRGGYTSAGLTAYFGKLAICCAPELALDQDPAGRHTNGHYTRASYQFSRLQSVSENASAYAALAGQWSNNNLDSADKIAIGGPRAVRAFSTSSGIGDEAQILNAEYRRSLSPEATVSVFYDIGRVRFNHAPLMGEDNNRILSGYGLGLYWSIMKGLSMRASLAWPRRDSGNLAGDGRNPRPYAQLVNVF